MDSVSQALFGSVVAVVVTGGRHPRRAALAGALFGTLPDLDVLVPQASDLEDMIDHRTWSHSWLVQTAVSPFLAVAMHGIDQRLHQRRLKRHRDSPPSVDDTWSRWQWFLLIWLVFFTHSILDALTIYGTWLFWPFGERPVMGGSIFIIDPLFTLPLLVATVGMISRRWRGKARWVASVALFLSCAYLAWGVFAKQHVERTASDALAAQGFTWSRLVATPTPFNSVLWRIIALDGDRYLEGFHRLGESAGAMHFCSHPRNEQLVESLLPNTDLARFARFNHGFHAFREDDGRLVGEDLRMGAAPYFFFSFVFAETVPGSSAENESIAKSDVVTFRSVTPVENPVVFDPGYFFGWLWQRMSDPETPPLEPSNGVCTGPA